jgi:crossover junction endodeoxyribonuclease RuvC
MPNKTVKLVLAMDLSLSLPAYAVLEIIDNRVIIADIRYTNNKKKSKLSHGERLELIANDIAQIFIDYPNIDAVVREKGFSKFPTATQTLFKVVGVSDLTIYKSSGITKIDEIAPTSVKKYVTGNGKSDKGLVEIGVRTFLVDEQRDITFDTDDCSDAVAVGIAWMVKNNYLK